MDHPGQRHHRHVPAAADDVGDAERDVIEPLRDRGLVPHQLAVFEKQDRITAAEGVRKQPLGIGGVGGNDDPQPRHLGNHPVVAAGMVGGGTVADADAAAEDHRHPQPAARHVAHLGDLVDDLAEGVEDEIGKHEVDHRAGASHCRATGKPHEATLANRRVAEALRAILGKQPRCRGEVAATDANPLPHHEDRRIGRHRLVEGLQRPLRPGPRRAVCVDAVRLRRHRPGGLGDRINILERRGRRRRRARLGRGPRVSDNSLDVGLDRRQIPLGDTQLRENGAEPGDRALLFPGVDFLAGAVGEVTHSLGMGPSAVGAAFEERRPLAPSRSLDRLTGGRMDGDEIVAVKLDAGEAVGGGTAADLGDAA